MKKKSFPRVDRAIKEARENDPSSGKGSLRGRRQDHQVAVSRSVTENLKLFLTKTVSAIFLAWREAF